MVFEETLQQGKTYNLEINFSADIRKDLRGFYISSYNCFSFYLLILLSRPRKNQIFGSYSI
jgi:hypothetical protein